MIKYEKIQIKIALAGLITHFVSVTKESPISFLPNLDLLNDPKWTLKNMWFHSKHDKYTYKD